jgi:hypothetical protein
VLQLLVRRRFAIGEVARLLSQKVKILGPKNVFFNHMAQQSLHEIMASERPLEAQGKLCYIIKYGDPETTIATNTSSLPAFFF